MNKLLYLLAALLLPACLEKTTDNFENPPPGPPDTCAPIAALSGCDQGAVSYGCSQGRPDDTSDPDERELVCSAGTPGGGGLTLYCCVPFTPYYSACAPDPGLAGCGGVAIGFSCTGGDDPPTTPTDADETLACSAATTGSDGARHYCCNSTAVPPTCAADPTVACAGEDAAYACVGSAAPSAAPGLACGSGTAGSDGATDYCCHSVAPT